MTADADGNDVRTRPTPGPAVLVPPGLPIVEAAAWVGHSCWAELALHQVLTDWLAVEADPAVSTALWALRAHRAELAEAWHRRLPELREHPRPGFVRPSTEGEAGVARLSAIREPSQTAERIEALTEALGRMQARYQSHVGVAVGPADAPTAATLTRAIETTTADQARLAARRAEARG